MCGEKFPILWSRNKLPGSTPRVWGKVYSLLICNPSFRFNPTCVGKRSSLKFPSNLSPVQPHVCGEKPISLRSDIVIVGSTPRVWGKEHEQKGPEAWRGSTPRVWGKADLKVEKFLSLRFNPTCVGKSHPLRIILAVVAVQPHVCGEKGNPGTGRTSNGGSTPRVWGKVTSFILVSPLVRFNPTCVGKSVTKR